MIDATGCFVIPGGVDTHTHLENPSLGVTRSADDFETGTLAAACGGTTTIVDFVKKEPDRSLYDSFVRRKERAESVIGIDLGLHPVVPSAALTDGSFDDLERLTADFGTASWKFFMAYPGLLMVDDATLIEGMRRCERLGVLAMVHAENGHLVADAVSRLVEGGCTAEHFHHDAHSHIAEAEAVNRAIAIAETTGATLFVVHVSSRDAAARDRRGAGRRCGGARRDLPAVPARVARAVPAPRVRGGGVRVLSADPRAGEPGAPVAGAADRRAVDDRHRPRPRSRCASPTTCRRRSRTGATTSPGCPTACPASRSGSR